MPLPQTIQFDELNRWIAEEGHTDRSFAKLARLDKMTVSRLRRGTLKRFEYGIISKVARATGDKVGVAQFTAFFARQAAAPKRRAA